MQRQRRRARSHDQAIDTQPELSTMAPRQGLPWPLCPVLAPLLNPESQSQMHVVGGVRGVILSCVALVGSVWRQRTADPLSANGNDLQAFNDPRGAHASRLLNAGAIVLECRPRDLTSPGKSCTGRQTSSWYSENRRSTSCAWPYQKRRVFGSERLHTFPAA